MLRRMFLAMTLSAAVLFAPAVQAVVDVQVAGNTATAEIDLGGVGAELILTFDDASNLSAGNLGIQAQLVDPLDASLLSRLSALDLAALPSALPLLITVEPPSTGGFSLRNTVRVEIHTHLLPYTAGSPLRIFKAPLNGAFRDITDEVAPGSVRTRGTTGGFSQFLILVDLRPTGTVIAQKVAFLRTQAAKLPSGERAPVASLIDAAESAVAGERYDDAIASIDALRAHVSSRAGAGIPNAWSPLARNGNVAGELLSGAATLKFSVGYLRDYGH